MESFKGDDMGGERPQTAEEGISTRRDFLRKSTLSVAVGVLAAAGISLKATKTAPRNLDKTTHQVTPHQEGLNLSKTPERSWRLEHPTEGTIIVWHPEYTGKLDGTVVYIPGDSTTPDKLWNQYHIADQFRESGKKALFIIPESLWHAFKYKRPWEHIKWKDNLDGLIQFVKSKTGVETERPITLVGQSAGYRSIANWLDCEAGQDVNCMIFLDSLFGYFGKFHRWLLEEKENIIILVSAKGEDGRMTTRRQSIEFAKKHRANTATFLQTPRRFDERFLNNLPKVIHIASKYEHSQIVSSGGVIPSVLRITNA